MAVAACSGEPANETEADLIERARGIHERVITLDTHNDINAAKCLAHNGHSHLRRSF
jgi:membrane dipeptidase